MLPEHVSQFRDYYKDIRKTSESDAAACVRIAEDAESDDYEAKMDQLSRIDKRLAKKIRTHQRIGQWLLDRNIYIGEPADINVPSASSLEPVVLPEGHVDLTDNEVDAILGGDYSKL